MITKADIEKIVYRAMVKMWGTNHCSPDMANFIAHDVWQVVKQDLPNKHSADWPSNEIAKTLFE